jgi:hypothetical protein
MAEEDGWQELWQGVGLKLGDALTRQGPPRGSFTYSFHSTFQSCFPASHPCSTSFINRVSYDLLPS